MIKADDNIASLFDHFRNYFTADLIAKAVAFLMLPVLTYALTPDDFGILSVFNSLTVLFLTLLTLNTYTSIGRYYFEENADFSSFLSSVLVFVFCISVFIYISVFYFKDGISAYMGIPESLVNYILPIVILLSIRSVYGQVCKAREHSRSLSRINIYSSVINAVVTILLLFIFLGKNYMSVVWANILVQFVVVIIILYLLRGYFKSAEVKKEHIKYSLAYGIPLIPYTLSSELLASFDVLMINKYINAYDAGLYGFSYKIGTLLLMFIIALNSAWTPKYMRYMNSGDYDKHKQFTIVMLRSTLIAAVVMICFGDILAILISPDSYSEGTKIIPLVALGYLFYMVFVIYNKHTTYVKKLIYQSIVALLAGALNVVLNLLLIPKYGYIAAAYTTLASFILMALLSWVVNSCVVKLYSVPISKILFELSPVILLVFIKQYLLASDISFKNAIFVNFVLMVAAILIIMRFNPFSLKEYKLWN